MRARWRRTIPQSAAATACWPRAASDRSWLAGLEDAIARHAVAASAARLALVTRLNARIEAGAARRFPPARIGLACPIAERLADRAGAGGGGLAARRPGGQPRRATPPPGQAALGAHRTDMLLTDVTTGTAGRPGQHRPAEGAADRRDPGACRTDRRGARVRPAAAARRTRGSSGRGAARRAMGACSASLPAQTFVTGTDADIFLPLAEQAEAFATGGGASASGRAISSPRSRRYPCLRRPARCYLSRVSIPHLGVVPRHVRQRRAAA